MANWIIKGVVITQISELMAVRLTESAKFAFASWLAGKLASWASYIRCFCRGLPQDFFGRDVENRKIYEALVLLHDRNVANCWLLGLRYGVIWFGLLISRSISR